MCIISCILNGNSSKLCILAYYHIMRCIFLQKFVLTIFDELLSFFCVEYLIKIVERTPPKWILLSRFDWNIFEGGIVLFESEYFIEKKSFYTKILLYFKWKLQIIFLKIWKIWGWSRGRHCFCVKNNLELMQKLSWKIKQLVDEYLTTHKM